MDMMVRELEDDAARVEKVVRVADEMSPEEYERFRVELLESHRRAEAGDLTPIDEILDEL